MAMHSLRSNLPYHLDEIGAVPAGIAGQPGEPGAALDIVLAHVQQQVPSATGLVVRDGILFVVYPEAPDEAARAASRAAIADQPALAELASRRASRLAAATMPTAADLRAQLLDATLPDDAWLRLFRRYQVGLLSGATAGPDSPDDKPVAEQRARGAE